MLALFQAERSDNLYFIAKLVFFEQLCEGIKNLIGTFQETT